MKNFVFEVLIINKTAIQKKFNDRVNVLPRTHKDVYQNDHGQDRVRDYLIRIAYVHDHPCQPCAGEVRHEEHERQGEVPRKAAVLLHCLCMPNAEVDLDDEPDEAD